MTEDQIKELFESLNLNKDMLKWNNARDEYEHSQTRVALDWFEYAIKHRQPEIDALKAENERLKATLDEAVEDCSICYPVEGCRVLIAERLVLDWPLLRKYMEENNGN